MRSVRFSANRGDAYQFKAPRRKVISKIKRQWRRLLKISVCHVSTECFFSGRLRISSANEEAAQ